jgi:hypothetical protein
VTLWGAFGLGFAAGALVVAAFAFWLLLRGMNRVLSEDDIHE